MSGGVTPGRYFHDEVLGNGVLPLDVLDSEVNAWIDGQESNTPLSTNSVKSEKEHRSY
jgi:hypothetical protein